MVNGIPASAAAANFLWDGMACYFWGRSNRKEFFLKKRIVGQMWSNKGERESEGRRTGSNMLAHYGVSGVKVSLSHAVT